MILCQISDTHIKADRKLAYGIVDTAAFLERCVADILTLPQRPDVVIATGDLVDWGRPDEYGLLRELLSPLTMPLYLMPGNHDERASMRNSFPGTRTCGSGSRSSSTRSTSFRCALSRWTVSFRSRAAAHCAANVSPGLTARWRNAPRRRRSSPSITRHSRPASATWTRSRSTPPASPASPRS